MFRLFLLFLLVSPFICNAQFVLSKADTNVVIELDTSKQVIVSSIMFVGNKKTKEHFIRRELSFKEGDTLPQKDLYQFLTLERNRIFNIGVFVSTRFIIRADTNGQAQLVIYLKERWFWFPVPIVELADRTFNEWWYNQNHDFSRINVGLKLTNNNMRGRGEELKILGQFGFTQKVEVVYRFPYLDKKQHFGLSIGGNYIENNQIAYRSEDNKQKFLKLPAVMLQRTGVAVNLSYRKSFYSYHNFETRYSYQQTADTVLQLNPQYFNTGQIFQQYLQLRYTYVRDRRDIQAYALHGYTFSFTLAKIGLLPSDNVHMGLAYCGLTKYLDLGHKFYFAGLIKGKLSTPASQPYNLARAFGFGEDFVRGYDLYVIEGASYGLVKSTLRRQMFNNKVHLRWIPFEQFKTIPLALYFNVFFDAGYVYNKNTQPTNERLTNRWLPGGGVGVDVVTFYDVVFRVEYSTTYTGSTGFYFYFTSDI